MHSRERRPFRFFIIGERGRKTVPSGERWGEKGPKEGRKKNPSRSLLGGGMWGWERKLGQKGKESRLRGTLHRRKIPEKRETAI